MENKVVDNVSRSFELALPDAQNMDGYLDKIIPEVKKLSEDLNEERFYLGKAWIEVRDDVDFHDTILHIFNKDGEYLKSTNGNLSSGQWRYLANKLIFGGKVNSEEEEEKDDDLEGEVYELAFLDAEFFILKKHGVQTWLGKRKYLVLLTERLYHKLEWQDAMEQLFNKYRNKNSFYITLSIIILLVMILLYMLR